MRVIPDAKHVVMLIPICWHIRVSLRLLQDAFQVGVDHERDAFLPAVIAETQSLVDLARQPNGALV